MHKSAVLAASAALGLAFTYAGSVYSAPSIYPVDTARFLAGSRFDFKVEFDGKVNEKDVRVLINGKPAESVLGGKPGFVSEESGVGASAILLRGAHLAPGKYTVTAEAPDGRAEAKRDVYGTAGKPRARSVILLIADGLSVGHRTAARLLSKGVTNGKYNGALAMDDMPHMALLGTCSVDSIAADSANTASAYMTGHKSSVNALGVYCDRTKDPFDDPRQENITEILRRVGKRSVGVVTDAEIEDATPAAVYGHTRRRAEKAALVEQLYNLKPEVILGGGSAYFYAQIHARFKEKG